MTGRELIMLILEYHLEDIEFSPSGYMTIEEAAVERNVGIATINSCIENGIISAIKIGDKYYIPKS